ncbi:16S rRNA (guanine(527)-N(7))-methyltransferase RsmG [Litorivita sp. NS0012-18]|uniref:16S rRNA (guanine(527)-N(7))-methyltransferase RsmG n=1 Tax=Litorivita sp. NS0012-18 TaxID=3127655 RepID=UPI0031099545
MIEGSDVSRETIERLEHFATLLIKWNPKINLVSKASLENLWERHIRDSVQVAQIALGARGHLVDLGSGGGFPGVVLAIMRDEIGLDKVTLIESDQRKCAFLRSALRETGASAEIISQRIELSPPQSADLVSARALADLAALLGHAERHLAPTGLCLFPKGRSWEKEVAEAREQWHFEHEAIPSKTEAGAVILRIGEIKRV